MLGATEKSQFGTLTCRDELKTALAGVVPVIVEGAGMVASDIARFDANGRHVIC